MKILNKSKQLWFWQSMITPHMSQLAVEMQKLGYNVHFVCNQILSKDRLSLGWERPALENVHLKLVKNKNEILKLSRRVPENSIHLVQGIRGNGIIKYAQKIFIKRNLNQWIMMETVNQNGIQGFLRNILYNTLLFFWKRKISGFLAIGDKMSDWLADRGVSKNKIFTFAYFLKKNNFIIKKTTKRKKIFKFIFVGQLIKRKRVDRLIRALATFKKSNFKLCIIGAGKEKDYLHALTNELLRDKVTWFDICPMHSIPKLINHADCLVLPSQHDGWGAVVSEALMVGTPVICTDSCGASVVVRASNNGCVVPVNNQKAFIAALRKQFNKGLWSLKKKKKLAKWASCLDAKNGAAYLSEILNYNKKNQNYLVPPWKLNIKKNEI